LLLLSHGHHRPLLPPLQIPYDELCFGKPDAQFYISDQSIDVYTPLEKQMGFYY
jgi:hypothetical protein